MAGTVYYTISITIQFIDTPIIIVSITILIIIL